MIWQLWANRLGLGAAVSTMLLGASSFMEGDVPAPRKVRVFAHAVEAGEPTEGVIVLERATKTAEPRVMILRGDGDAAGKHVVVLQGEGDARDLVQKRVRLRLAQNQEGDAPVEKEIVVQGEPAEGVLLLQDESGGDGQNIFQHFFGGEGGQQNVRVFVTEDGQVKVVEGGEGDIQVHGYPMNVAGQPIKLGEFWVGLGCSNEPLSGLIRKQLKLGAEQGLVVQSVVADSPAAKAGFKEDDILIAAGEKELNGVQALVDAVEAAKESPISFKVIRDGESMTIEVTPAKRPQDQGSEPQSQERHARVLELLNKHGIAGGAAGGGDVSGFKMFNFAPGVMLGGGFKHDLPKNMSVSITKTGEEPAKIYVKMDDKSWEVTEDKIDELPEDVRGHVKAMMGGSGRMQRFDVRSVMPGFPGGAWQQRGAAMVVPGVPAVPGTPPVPGVPGMPGRVRARVMQGMDEGLINELRELRDELRKLRDEMKGTSPGDATPKSEGGAASEVPMPEGATEA